MRRYQRRLLIIFGSVFGILLVLFLLFNLLILNLFEGSVASILEIVPKKGVTYVVTTEAMGPGIDRLAESAFIREAKDSKSVRSFLDSEVWKEFQDHYGIEENLDRLVKMRDELPIDVMRSLFGDEILLAGSPNVESPNRWDYLLFTRIDWKMKIGIDFCDIGPVKSRLDSSIDLARVTGERYREVGLNQAGKVHRFFFARVKDVLIVTNKEPLMQSVLRLVEMGPSLSLGFDKTFVKATMPEVHGAQDTSFFVNIGSLWSRLGIGKSLDEASLPGQVRFLLEFVNPTRLSLASGRLTLSESPEWISEFLLGEEGIQFEHEFRIFNSPPVELREAVGRFETFVPDTCFFYGYLKCPSKDLFTLLGSQVKERGRELVDERLAEKPRYKDFDDFLTKTAANFGRDVSLALSRIEYDRLPYRADPAVTLFFDVEDHDLLAKFLDYLTGDEFALESMSHEEYKGVTVSRGFQKLPLIEFAEELAYATIENTFILSTSKDFLMKVVDTYNQHAPSLFATEQFRETSKTMPLNLNGFGYWNFRLLLEWADEYKEFLAVSRSQVPENTWNEFRSTARRTVMARNPGLSREDLEERTEEEVVRLGEAYTVEETARWRDWYREKIDWARILGDAALSLNFVGQNEEQVDRVQLRVRLSLTP